MLFITSDLDCMLELGMLVIYAKRPKMLNKALNACGVFIVLLITWKYEVFLRLCWHHSAHAFMAIAS